MKCDKKTMILIIIVLLIVGLDQGFKLYSLINFNESTNTNTIITYEESSSGVAQNNVVTSIVTNIVVLGIIIKFFVNQKDRIDMNLVVTIAFLLAGGISNLIDKIFRGSVINYIKLYNFPTINLSFLFIIIGWIGLASIFAWSTYKELKKREELRNK